MKRDIDRLMQERNIDVAIVSGKVVGNPSVYYLLDGVKLTGATVIKKQGEEAVLLHAPMEREEAAKCGLRTISTSTYDYRSILEDAGGDQLRASVEYYCRVFDDLGVSGRVAFYGIRDAGMTWKLLEALNESLSNVEVTGEFSDDMFVTARATKGPEEIERIKRAGVLTCEIVRHTVDFMKSHKLRGDTLTKEDGSPLTIGDCKREIRMALAARNLTEEVDTIFAIGRDAGIPHSCGTDTDPMTTGRTIIFDIFPQEKGGGYFFDMTRTFCLGEAPAEVRDTYKQLEECFDTVSGAFRAGKKASVYQKMTCEFFAKLGHDTIEKDPQATSGYVHSLGHGIGLQVHEKPALADYPGNEDVLAPGSVFTVEPGLYYPDRGYGMRIEDVMYVDESGAFHNLTDFPRDLVVPV